MRDVVAWGVLQARTWVAFSAAFVATFLASGDGQGGWTVVVALATCSLAALSVWAHYLDEHPEASRRSRHDEWVADSVRRYEAARRRVEPPPPAREPWRARRRRVGSDGRRLSKEEALAAEILRRYEVEAAARRAARGLDPGPR